MKSVFLSILMFVVVFLFAGSNFLTVVGEDWFHYSAYFVFALVMLCAVYVTLIKNHATEKNTPSAKKKDSTLKIEQKEEEHDKE